MNRFQGVPTIDLLGDNDALDDDEAFAAEGLHVLDLLDEEIEKFVDASDACLRIFDKTLRPACEATEDERVEKAFREFIEPFGKLSMMVITYQVSRYNSEHPDNPIDFKAVLRKVMEGVIEKATTNRPPKLS